MILIDSSAWIEFYHHSGSNIVKDAVEEAISNDVAAVNGVITVEILSFITNPRHYESVSQDFGAFHWIGSSRSVFKAAASLGRELRAKGLTIPATDLIIAATALEHKTQLLHLDRHFEQIAEHCDLRTINPTGLQVRK